MYWELSDTERFTALWFCQCTEDQFDVEENDLWWICQNCGTSRRVHDLKLEEVPQTVWGFPAI